MSISFSNLTTRKANLNLKREYDKLIDFLAKDELTLDLDVEYTLVTVDDQDNFVATGSLAGSVLKSIAVSSEYKSSGLSGNIVSKLIEKAAELGRFHLFIFTKPKNIFLFEGSGFKTIARVDPEIALMDNNTRHLQQFTEQLSKQKKDGKTIATIVMNCNPFTLGHLSLIEEAAKNSDWVHLFLVKENKSVFPYADRYQLVQLGIAHLKNVILHEGSEYIISQATFPTYFFKDKKIINKVYAQLDLTIFAQYIVPALGINYRYVGTEPNDVVTAVYNQTMKEVLEPSGVRVHEILRKESDSKPISASYVRSLLKTDSYEAIKNLVPQTTYDYLISEQTKPIIEKLKASP